MENLPLTSRFPVMEIDKHFYVKVMVVGVTDSPSFRKALLGFKVELIISRNFIDSKQVINRSDHFPSPFLGTEMVLP